MAQLAAMQGPAARIAQVSHGQGRQLVDDGVGADEQDRFLDFRKGALQRSPPDGPIAFPL
ncbi:hypothetical protein D3C72_2328230 [compost metagenome]